MGWPFNSDKSALVVTSPEPATYEAHGVASGPSGGGPSGDPKHMLSLFNPSGSGKTIKVLCFGVVCESSSGTAVIITYEIRRIEAHSAGTVVTPRKRAFADAASIAEVKVEPTVTEESGGEPVTQRRFTFQANTMQNPNGHEIDLTKGGAKPIVLAEGKGITLYHETSGNGGDFRSNFVWSEA